MKSYDKKGIPIEVGDVLKIFHFISGKKNYYMYKWVIKKKKYSRNRYYYLICHLVKISLDVKNCFYMFADDKIHDDIEIVSGIRADFISFEDRPRKTN